MERFERFISDEIQRGRPLIGTYPPSSEVRARYSGWVKDKN